MIAEEKREEVCALKLDERAVSYYLEQDKGCGVAILRAASDHYALGLSEEACALFEGFRTGMGCGSTCGSLTGAMGVLSAMFANRADFKDLCGRFVARFTEHFGCTDCEMLAAKYKTADTRCAEVVRQTAQLLGQFVEETVGKKETVHSKGTVLDSADIKRVKGLGCLQDKRYSDVFNVRVITRNGRITTDEHRAIAEAADRFGSGCVAMTTRLTMEIQGVQYEQIQPLISFLKGHGLDTGGTGSLIRPVVSCKGTTCQYGLIDTYALSEEIHNRFYLGFRGVTLPHKFKIAVGGCPNNCVKPELNDLGIIGQKVPVVDLEKCRGCKKCQVAESCPIQIAKIADGKVSIDPAQCNNCGRCDGKCPFGAVGYTNGYRICVGGRWGKRVAHGVPLDKIFTSREEVLDMVENVILFYRNEGISGERLSDTIARLGFDYVQKKLLDNQIDKAAILTKDVKGGASC